MRRIWTKCIMISAISFQSRIETVYANTKEMTSQEVQSYKSSHLPTRVHLLSLLFEGSVSFLEHWLFRAF